VSALQAESIRTAITKYDKRAPSVPAFTAVWWEGVV
jgi:hypothetical protein